MTMKLIKYGIPLLATACVGFALATSVILTPQEQMTAAPNPPAVTTLGDGTIAGLGEVQAAGEPVAVGTPVSGLVREVSVVAGQQVKKGDLLFAIDDRDLRAELAMREAGLRVAESRLNRAKAGTRPEDLPPARAKVDVAKVTVARAEDAYARVVEIRSQGAVSQEEYRTRQFAVQQAKAELSDAASVLARLEAGTWSFDIELAEAEVGQARAAADRVKADLDRLMIRAPVNAAVLRVSARVGEYQTTGSEVPPVLLGTEGPCQVRVQVDEEDAGRLIAGAAAEGYVRGRDRTRVPLRFVRIEPRMVPKSSTTGVKGERVDTRVLVVVYEITDEVIQVYPGQKLDVFIGAYPEAS
jgi:HlyD family secretion protein